LKACGQTKKGTETTHQPLCNYESALYLIVSPSQEPFAHSKPYRASLPLCLRWRGPHNTSLAGQQGERGGCTAWGARWPRIAKHGAANGLVSREHQARSYERRSGGGCECRSGRAAAQERASSAASREQSCVAAAGAAGGGWIYEQRGRSATSEVRSSVFLNLNRKTGIVNQNRTCRFCIFQITDRVFTLRNRSLYKPN
jgi:hypothetical protein